MNKAVIYARYSSDSQSEQSIEGQMRVCKEYAEKNGYVIVGEYVDRAITGTNDKRPAFQQMISDSKKLNGVLFLSINLIGLQGQDMIVRSTSLF